MLKVRLMLFACAVLPLCGSAERSFPATAAASVVVRGSTIEVEARDGSVMRTDQLAGAIITVRRGPSTVAMRIDAVLDGHADGELRPYLISIRRVDGSWVPLCNPAPDDSRWAFPISGQSRPDGTLDAPTQNRFEIVCSSGAQGKCLRLGYLPWRDLPDGSSGLGAFNACVHMVRADYAGQGISRTRDGTLISVSDTVGVHPSSLATRNFEAGWDNAGAVCVRRSRHEDLATPRQIADASARLVGQVGSHCTPEKAIAMGAILLSRSAS